MIVLAHFSSRAILNKAEAVSSKNNKSKEVVEEKREDIDKICYDQSDVVNTSLNFSSVKDFYQSVLDIYGLDYLNDIEVERVHSEEKGALLSVYSTNDGNISVVGYEEDTIVGVSVSNLPDIQDDIKNKECPVWDFKYNETNDGFYLER